MTPFDAPVTTQPFQNVENGPSQPKQYDDQIQNHPARDPQFREGHNVNHYNHSNDPPIQFDGLRNPYDDAVDRHARSPQVRQEYNPQVQHTPDRFAQPYDPSHDFGPRDIPLKNDRDEPDQYRRQSIDSKSSFSNERAGEAAFDRSPREEFASPREGSM